MTDAEAFPGVLSLSRDPSAKGIGGAPANHMSRWPSAAAAALSAAAAEAETEADAELHASSDAASDTAEEAAQEEAAVVSMARPEGGLRALLRQLTASKDLLALTATAVASYPAVAAAMPLSLAPDSPLPGEPSLFL